MIMNYIDNVKVDTSNRLLFLYPYHVLDISEHIEHHCTLDCMRVFCLLCFGTMPEFRDN